MGKSGSVAFIFWLAKAVCKKGAERKIKRQREKHKTILFVKQ